jgi:hypothetical protein
MSLLDLIESEKRPATPRVVALDSETRPFAAGELDPPPACFSWCFDDFVPGLIHGNDAEEFLRDLLRNHIIVGANFAYDAAVIIKRFPGLISDVFDAYNQDRILDIQIAQRLVDIAHGRLGGYYDVRGFSVRYFYSLAELHERCGFGTLEKPAVRMEYGDLIPLPLEAWPEPARKYAKDDAVATLKVWQAQQQYAELLGNLAAQCRAAFGLQLMSVVGMRTDAARADAYIQDVHEEIERARVELLKAGLVRKDGSKDTKKAKALMLSVCREHGYDLKPTETALKRWKNPSQAQLIESGLFSLDAEACRDSCEPLLKSYATFTSASGMIKRAQTLRQGADLPLQARFQVLMDNGRTSCSEPKAPLIGQNLQNLPKEGQLRSLFTPPTRNYWGIS